jgi:hypothetical protein
MCPNDGGPFGKACSMSNFVAQGVNTYIRAVQESHCRTSQCRSVVLSAERSISLTEASLFSNNVVLHGSAGDFPFLGFRLHSGVAVGIV